MRSAIVRATPAHPEAWLVTALLACLTFALLGAPGDARGTSTPPTLYVDRNDPSCSDSGSGMAGQPFCSIGAAARQLVAGQRVQVAAGEYPEAVTVSTSGTSSAPITFAAARGAAVTVSGQTNGFVISGKRWITITGFTIRSTISHGISVVNSSHITISNCHVSYAGKPSSGETKSGIRFSNVSDSVVSGNVVDHNSAYGMNFVGGSTRNLIKRNTSFSNAMRYQRAASGIRFYGSPGNRVSSNVCHDNEDSGIEFFSGSSNNLVTNNVTYNNGDHGIDNYRSTGQRVIANSVYHNVTAGINVEEGSTGAMVANNISVDNGVSSPRTTSNIRVDSDSTAGTRLDYDVVFLGRGSGTLLTWNSVGYGSLASFQGASKQELHGIQASPNWMSPDLGDFHLLAGSPAVDSANSGVRGQPAADADGSRRIDASGTANTGVGSRTYDDRGAYEFHRLPRVKRQRSHRPRLRLPPPSLRR